MAKSHSRYVCQECGATSTKWLGYCAQCGNWNTYQEEIVTREVSGTPGNRKSGGKSTQKAKPIQEIPTEGYHRIPLVDEELSRVLGGGIIPGSLTLVAGQPGIGKSTLMLQTAIRERYRVLYVTGEESLQQVKMRAERLGMVNEECFLLAETNLDAITRQIEEVKPLLVIIDSVQTIFTDLLESAPGTVSQVRETSAILQQFAKQHNIAIGLIGHITKEGSIAGPKVLEHIVDAVLQFEGDPHYHYRILRCLKNRFGSIDEMGIYEMEASGLREVSNPSELFLSNDSAGLSGSAIAVVQEGRRAILLETQALVSTAVYGTAQRSATGFDTRRLHMLLAVLEKRSGFTFGNQDVFLNLAGGLKVNDPALDLAVVAALISSLQDIPNDAQSCFTGEVGLSGEIRAVSHIEQRIREADRLGLQHMYLPAQHRDSLKGMKAGLSLHFVTNIHDMVSEVFG